MKIALDLDGVLADTMTHTEAALSYRRAKWKEKRNDDLYFQWDFFQGLAKEDEELVRKMWEDLHFWRTIPRTWFGIMTPSFLEALTILGHEVVIITAPWLPVDGEKFRQIREDWVFWNIGDYPVMFSNEKEKLDFDLLIDDKEDTVDKCGDRGLLFNTRFNRSDGLETAAEFMAHVMRMVGGER